MSTFKRWVIEPAALQQRLSEGLPTIVMDCRFALADPGAGYVQYQAGHIPGAYYLNLDTDLSGPAQGSHGGRHPLPDVEVFSRRLRDLGVSSCEPTLVVAYDDNRFGFASRLWWLMRYLGHDEVNVLNGGLAGWIAGGYPIDATVPDEPAQAGNFEASVKSSMVASFDEVAAWSVNGGATLVDAREEFRYRGEQEPIDPVAGHIPGAVNIPWQEASFEDGALKPVSDHEQRWSEHEGFQLVSYCGSGVTACVNLFSLALAGRDDAVLYVGSWSDWCSRPGAIIATEL